MSEIEPVEGPTLYPDEGISFVNIILHLLYTLLVAVTSPDIRINTDQKESLHSPLHKVLRSTRSLIDKVSLHRAQRKVIPEIDFTQPETIIQTKKPEVPQLIIRNTPSETSRESRETKRQRRKAEYEAWKRNLGNQSSSILKSQPEKQSLPAATSVPKIEQNTLDQTREIVITPEEIPWITSTERVKLKLIRLNTGATFWYVDFIRNLNLLKAKKKVERAGKMSYMDKLLLTRMEGYLQNTTNLYIRELDYSSTPNPILKFSATNGARIYCQQGEQVEGVKTFIRLAICADTTSENNLVMPVLSPRERRK